jgi:5-methylcytosine-specific restriction endonuclease McrA
VPAKIENRTRCRKCGRRFPRTAEFWQREKTSADGFRTECKECRKSYRDALYVEESKDPTFRECNRQKAAKWYAENRDYAMEQARIYHAQPDIAAKRHARTKERRTTEPEFIEANKRRCNKHYRANTKRYRANSLAWRAANPDKARAMDTANNAARRARKQSAPGRYDSKDIIRLLKNQGNICFWCKDQIASGKHTVDHYIPLARGGSNWPKNLVIACLSCNAQKADKLPHEYRAYLRKYRDLD